MTCGIKVFAKGTRLKIDCIVIVKINIFVRRLLYFVFRADKVQMEEADRERLQAEYMCGELTETEAGLFEDSTHRSSMPRMEHEVRKKTMLPAPSRGDGKSWEGRR